MIVSNVPISQLAEINPRVPNEAKGNMALPVSFLPMSAISEKGYIENEEVRIIGDVFRGYTYFERGDVLVAKITPCLENGKAAIADKLSHKIGFGTTEFHILRPKKGTHPRYLFHQIWNPRFRFYATRAMKGAAGQKRVPVDFFDRYEVPFPKYDEQKRIAAILDKADGIRRKRQQAIQLADEFLRSVFLDMFGDPVSNPKGWDTISLGEWADILTGYPFPSAEYVAGSENTIKLCRGANVLPGHVDWSDTVHWPENNTKSLDKYWLIEGDVVLALDRPWISSGLKVARIEKQDFPSLLVQRVARIRGKSPSETIYFLYLIKHPAFKKHCRPTETTVPHISPTELHGYIVPRPNEKLLQDFYELSQIYYRKTRKFRSSESEFKRLFASCAQRAFRGDL